MKIEFIRISRTIEPNLINLERIIPGYQQTFRVMVYFHINDLTNQSAIELDGNVTYKSEYTVAINTICNISGEFNTIQTTFVASQSSVMNFHYDDGCYNSIVNIIVQDSILNVISKERAPIGTVTLYDNAQFSILHRNQQYFCDTRKLNSSTTRLEFENIRKMIDLAPVIQKICEHSESSTTLPIAYNHIDALRFYQSCDRQLVEDFFKITGMTIHLTKLDYFIARNFLKLAGVCKEVKQQTSDTAVDSNKLQQTNLESYKDILYVIFSFAKLELINPEVEELITDSQQRLIEEPFEENLAGCCVSFE